MSDASLGRRFTEWSRREPRYIDWKAAGRMTGSERVKRPANISVLAPDRMLFYLERGSAVHLASGT
jgi:hypothetical protein